MRTALQGAPKALAAALICCLSANLFAGQTILDTIGWHRVWVVLEPPVARTGDGLRRLGSTCNTPAPPADWARAGFDDAPWPRVPGAPFASPNSWSIVSRENAGFVSMDHSAPCISRIYMRSYFTVDDPARAGTLTLELSYRGGAAAYLNGVEVARGNLAKDAADGLAEDYPSEAFLGPDGSVMKCDQGEKREEYLRRWRLRTRALGPVDIPAALVRKGVNVLAVEIRRAAYDDDYVKKVVAEPQEYNRVYSLWSTCGLVTMRLTAGENGSGTPDGVKGPGPIFPNVARPKGLQAWNSPTAAADYDLDWGDPTEPLAPVRLSTARGGRASGKVAAGADTPLVRLRATVTDFVQTNGAARIPRAAAIIRYGVSPDAGSSEVFAAHYGAAPGLFDALSESPPDEVAVYAKPAQRGNWKRPGQPSPVFGAVCPVWLTVEVPRDAAPGEYTAALTIEAEGRAPVKAPVALRVSAFTLPPASEYRTVVDFVESPESVALQYNVPLWSDAHFKLLAKSFRVMGLVGNWSVYLPLVARTNFGNEQSLVRWIRKGDGSFAHDFAPLERYLDICIANMGKPRLVCIEAWDVFLGGQPYGKQDQEGKPAPVTCLDPATGAATTIELPRYGTPEAVALWKPVAEGVMARLKARGLDRCAVIGLVPDGMPSKDALAHFGAVFPGVPWMRHSHSERKNLQGAPIAYQCLVWTPRFAAADGASQRGWARSENWTQFCRSRDAYPPLQARLLGEMNIAGSQRGFGRIGLDFWQVLADRKGRRTGTLQARYPESAWANLDWMIRDFVPPGPEGAMETARIELMRVGLEECEARITVEDALGDAAKRAKLGDAFAKRAEEFLRARTRMMLTGLDNHLCCGFGKPSTQVHGWWSTPGQTGHLWFRHSGWQENSAELFDLAAEVQRATR